jgi:hypothetical protein
MEMKEMSLVELRTELDKLSNADKRVIFLEDGSQVSEFKAIYNTTKKVVETIASNNYALIQHKDAFTAIVDALEALGKTKVRAGICEYKGRAWLTITFPEITVDDGSEGIEMGIRMVNSYRANSALKIESGRDETSRYIGFFGYRKVCSNGMTVRIPLREVDEERGDFVKAEEVVETRNIDSVATRIIHMGDQEKKVMQIKNIISTLVSSMTYVESVVAEAKAEGVGPEEAKERLRNLGFGKRLTEKIIKNFEVEEQNRWGLYNAITNYATHDTRTPGSEETHLRRAEVLLASPLVSN